MKFRNYVKVTSIEEAKNVLLENENNAVYGGGAWLKLQNKEFETLIDISGLNLAEIEEDHGIIRIGSMTTLRQLEQNRIINNLCGGLLSKAAKSIMGIPVRNIATIGGTIMGKYAFSDILTALLVMDTTLHFYSSNDISLNDYLQSKGRIKDILIGISISLPNTSSSYFHTVKKTALDFPIINVAINKTESISIAIGARPSIAMMANKTMDYLNSLDQIIEADITKAIEITQKEIKVSTNNKASEIYRRELLKAYLERGLKEVLL